MPRRKKLTRDQALAKLKETRELSTGLLEPLGISFEAWLRFAQLPSERCAEITEQLITKLEKEAPRAE
jgi:hypothetical protein